MQWGVAVRFSEHTDGRWYWGRQAGETGHFVRIKRQPIYGKLPYGSLIWNPRLLYGWGQENDGDWYSFSRGHASGAALSNGYTDAMGCCGRNLWSIRRIVGDRESDRGCGQLARKRQHRPPIWKTPGRRAAGGRGTGENYQYSFQSGSSIRCSASI